MAPKLFEVKMFRHKTAITICLQKVMNRDCRIRLSHHRCGLLEGWPPMIRSAFSAFRCDCCKQRSGQRQTILQSRIRTEFDYRVDEIDLQYKICFVCGTNIS